MHALILMYLLLLTGTIITQDGVEKKPDLVSKKIRASQFFPPIQWLVYKTTTGFTFRAFL